MERAKSLIEFSLEDGSSVIVEVDEHVPEGGVVPAARPGEIAQKAGQTFEAALQKIRPLAGAVLATLRDVAPDEAQIEFGIKFNAKAGTVLASAGVDANYKITLIWKNPGQD